MHSREATARGGHCPLGGCAECNSRRVGPTEAAQPVTDTKKGELVMCACVVSITMHLYFCRISENPNSLPHCKGHATTVSLATVRA